MTATRTAATAPAGDGNPDDPNEWVRDAISSLQSVADDHPELVVLDLGAEQPDVTAMLRGAHDALVSARKAGVANAVPLAVAVRLLTESLVECQAMLAELEAGEAPGTGRRAGDIIDAGSAIVVREPVAV